MCGTNAFHQLAAALSPALLRYLRHQTGDEATASDLLQETLIRIRRGLPAFEGRSSVRTWAFAIAGPCAGSATFRS